MKKITLYLLSSLFLAGLSVSCSDEDRLYPNENEIVSFSITVGGELKAGVKTEEGDVIQFKMAPGFDPQSLAGLTPSIFISGYATISPLPSEPQDFNEPLPMWSLPATGQKGNGL